MSDGKKYYCFCGSNCKYETMTKEQILTAIAQAVETGSVRDVDTGFVTTIKEKNGGCGVTFWVGTQAQYNALAEKEQNCMYIITDDTTKDDILRAYENTTKAANEATAAAAEAKRNAADALQAANEAKATARSNRNIFFTGAVALSWVVGSGGQLTESLNFFPRRYEYSPVTGLVHFAFTMQFKGKINAGDVIEVSHAGSLYLPHASGLNAPIATDSADITAYYNCSDDPRIFIHVNKDIGADGKYYSIDFIGWYFHDADGAEG